MVTEQTNPPQPNGPYAPSSSPSDGQLDADLRGELSVLDQDPSHAVSPWAAAVGVTSPSLNLGGGGAGGYEFSPAALEAVIGQWHAIVDRAQKFDENIRVITEVTTAAADEASTGFTSQAQTLGRNVRASHATLTAYAAAYVAKLETVQRNYQATEQQITASLKGGIHS